MQTKLATFIKSHPEGEEADEILRKCVHCGFCTATCPTYQVLGDELDGPRGRIYLIKQLLEGHTVGHTTQRHLDRCLTCRGCETTCPSGVRYGRLLDIGRGIVESKVKRAISDRISRWLVRKLLPYPNRLRPLYGLAYAVRPILPESIKRRIPLRVATRDSFPKPRHRRKIVMLKGCVQDVFANNINTSAVRVLDAVGISTIFAEQGGCCGAVDFHLACHEDGKMLMRKNIDAWWPYIEQGIEAIVSTASGCGVTIKDYGDIFKGDSDYADKAATVSEMATDLCEILSKEDLKPFVVKPKQRMAFQSPCTLQHGQSLRGVVEKILDEIGIELVETSESHLCCGSAGTYSIFQPTISSTLLRAKVDHLESVKPDTILTANIGCLLHIQSATKIPVKHWIEILDQGGDRVK